MGGTGLWPKSVAPRPVLAAQDGRVYYHGTPDERTWGHGASYGIHIGTEDAARQALHARIGQPAEGEWDGTREYGKTLLNQDQVSHDLDRETGEWHRRVKSRPPRYPTAGATYSGGEEIPMDARPSVFPVRIKGPMTNSPERPHGDWHANGYMRRQISQGNARSGYYYTNVSEDSGSVSAVVPSAAHLERVHPPREAAAADGSWYHGTYREFRPDELVSPGQDPTFGTRDEVMENQPVYMSSNRHAAGAWAEEGIDSRRRRGEDVSAMRPRVYQVTPTGHHYPDDSNEEEFTPDYVDHASASPLRVVREVPFDSSRAPWRQPGYQPGRPVASLLDGKDYDLDLYHHTDPESARDIAGSGSFRSEVPTEDERGGEPHAYFSSREDGSAAEDYGAGAYVHVRVPSGIAKADDYTPSGEIFYKVPTRLLRREHIIGAHPIRREAAVWSPSSGIFAPTTGLDQRLFEGGSLRPMVRAEIMERLDRCIRVDVQLAGTDWQQWLRVWLAGGSASEWAGGRPNDEAQDLDVLVGLDLAKAQGNSSFEGMDVRQAATALNAAFRAAFNDPHWQPASGGTWSLTAYCNPLIGSDITAIRPYAAWDLTGSRWAVSPPHLPEHTLADFDPAVVAHARAVLAEARAILRMPEPLRTREARSLWQHVHEHRCEAFSAEGTGWDDPGNVDEKMLAYAPRGVLEKIRDLAMARTASAAPNGLDFEYFQPGTLTRGGRPHIHTLVAHHDDAPDDRFPHEAGHIQWRGEDGKITSVSVYPPMQRQGIATELLRRAQEITPGVTISHATGEALSDDARAWADALENRTAAREEAAPNPPCCYCGEPLEDEDVRDGQSAHEECSDMRWCQACGEHHDDPQETEDHNESYTDWGDRLPFEHGIHRGITVRLPEGVHAVVHDEARPDAERAGALAAHLRENPADRSDERGHAGGYGVHWTDHELTAQAWGTGEGAMFGPSEDQRSGREHTHVVMHAASPDEEHIETDPRVLTERNLLGFGHARSEREIPLRAEAPVRMTGLSWKRADQPEWHRHDFPEPSQHVASANTDPGPHENASAELPLRHGLWYRAHPEGAFPIDPGRAQSRIIDGRGRSIGQRGLSAMAHPVHLMGYLGHAEWYDLDDENRPAWNPATGSRKIIAFHGTEVGRGADDEPLVMPKPDHSCCGRTVHATWSLPRFDQLTDEHYPNPTGAITWSPLTHDRTLERASGERGEHRRREVDRQPGGHLGAREDDDEDAFENTDRYVACDQGHDHWGSLGAAGLLVRHQGDDGQHRYLLQHRSPYVQHGGTWSTPGGALRYRESPEEGARRETVEEFGPLPRDLTHHHTISDNHGGWAYHTVVMDSPHRFTPEGGKAGGWESSGHGWFTPEEMKGLQLHPGFAASWAKVRKSGAVQKAAVAFDAQHPAETGDPVGEHGFKYIDENVQEVPDHVHLGRLPVDTFQLSDITVAGQPYLNPEKVREYRDNPPRAKGKPPHVVLRPYGENDIAVVDGHHAIAGARARGDESIRARWVDDDPTEDKSGTPGASWSARTAASWAKVRKSGAVEKTASPYEIKFEPDYHGRHRVSAWPAGYQGDTAYGEPIGSMQWHPESGTVTQLHVRQLRSGVGTALWRRAHEEAARAGIAAPVHSPSRTPAADAWARSVGGETPPLSEEAQDPRWIAALPEGAQFRPRTAAYDPDSRIVRNAAELGWGDDEWAEARREPWHAAARLAQHQVRFDHPNLGMQFPDQHSGGDEMVGRILGHAGYQGDTSGAFVARHPNPEARTSNPSWLRGAPGVALHPERWDYGTVAHECAHHAVMYDHAAAPNEHQPDEQIHGPEWAGHYASALNRISKGAGDDFLGHHRFYRDMIGEGLQYKRPGDLDAADRRRREQGGKSPWRTEAPYVGTAKTAVTGYDGLTERSGMIYLDLPEGAVRPLPGGVDDHHITLVYLGKDVSDEQFGEALRRAREAAGDHPPMEGSIGGLGSFPPSDSSENKTPVFVPVDVPGIHKLRRSLEDLSGSEFKKFVPHVTRAYLEKGDAMPAPHPTVPVSFGRLHVKRGDEIQSFPLMGSSTTKTAALPRFFHGTDSKLSDGDLITPGRPKVNAGSDPRHVYFTEKYEHAEGAARGAASRHSTSYDAERGTWVHGEPAEHYVYEVKPTGEWGQDQQLPWTPYSHQSAHPLQVVRDATRREDGSDVSSKIAAWDRSGSEKHGVYLRFGEWPHDERSYSPAGGYKEEGVSVYDLDDRGEPSIDHGLDRTSPWRHEHDKHCEPDCDLADYDDQDDPGNDPRDEMQGRVRRAEKNRYYGEADPGATGHLVKGDVTGVGYDGEPLLKNVRRVGDWIDHRHQFIYSAAPHRLARDEASEDYEPPEEKPGVHHP